MKFYLIEEDTSPLYTGSIEAVHKWGLPGVEPCPTCRSGGGIGGLAYPCVDLSSLPEEELKKLSNPWPVPREEIERLCELVRPFVPAHAGLEPGVEMGPLTGKGSGHLGQLVAYYSTFLLVRREALERMQTAGMRGLEQSCPVHVRFRGKSPPALLEIQLELHGMPHTECVSPKSKPRCPTCGYTDIRYLSPLILDSASLPEGIDVFRLRQHFAIIANERFVETVQRLELDGVTFREVEAR